MDQTVFKRYELKYRLTRFQYTQLVACMAPYMVPDSHGRNVIQSLYLDTPDFLLARRSSEHPLYKEKLRFRSYGVPKPDELTFVELKKKFRSVTYKRRIGMTAADAEDYLWQRRPGDGSQISREIDYCFQRYPQLAPRIMLSYQREAWYGKEDANLRITFDNTILWRDHDLSPRYGIEGEPLLGEDEVLMEIKVANAMPSWLVTALSAQKLYKTSFSKYGTAYQARFRQIHHVKGVLRYA
jgi:hypothetical protein